jgi:hypothetical protein
VGHRSEQAVARKTLALLVAPMLLRGEQAVARKML